MRLLRAGLVGVVTLLLACGGSDADYVAKVNGQGITKLEFDQAVERNMARYKGQSHQLPPGIETKIKESVLRRMIDDTIIEQKGKELGVAVTTEELEGKFKEHKDRFRTEEAFADYLKRSGNTVENMRDDLKRNLMRDRVVEKLSGAVDINDEEVGKYYTENVQRFTEREQVKASRILVRLAANATDAEKKQAKKQAQDLQKKAAKGGADFAALAKEHSKGPEASRGGELGMLTRGRMTPEFDTVAFKLDAGKVSDVVESKLGYEIIKVFEKTAERQKPVDEVKESIKNSLLARKRNEKRRDVLRDLKAGAKVEQLVKFEAAPAAPGAPPTPGMPPQPRVARPGDIQGMEQRLQGMAERGEMPPGMAPPPEMAPPTDGAPAPAPAGDHPDHPGHDQH
jgi:peptidyl-prolyl cis-trans isomerase C